MNRSFCISLTLFIVAFGYVFFLPALRFGDLGTNDFIEYWSAYQVFRDGKNLYAPELMQNIQLSLGRNFQHPLMMWNPPWVFVFLAPLCTLSFGIAAKAWLVCNVFALTAATALLCNSNRPRQFSPLVVLLASFLFFPSLLNLAVGQLSILLTLFVCLFLWAIERRLFVFAGICLAVLTLKFHLFLLLFLLVMFWSLRERNGRVILGCSLTLILFATVSEFSCPNSLLWWTQSVLGTDAHPLLIRTLDWKTASLSYVFAQAVSGLSDRAYLAALFLFPLVVAFTCLGRAIARQTFSWQHDGLLYLAIGTITAPFLWTFDLAVLLPLFVALFLPQRTTARHLLVLGILLLLQIVPGILALQGITQHHQFFWWPLPLLLLWFYSGSKSTDSNSPPVSESSSSSTPIVQER